MNTVFFIIGGLAVGFLVLRYFPGKSQEAELAHTQKRLEEAKEKAAKIRAEAKEKVERMQRAFAEEETSTKESVAHMESMLKEKEDMVKRRTDRNKSYAGNVKALKKEIQELIEAYAASRKKGIDILSKASKLTPDAALKQAQAEVE